MGEIYDDRLTARDLSALTQPRSKYYSAFDGSLPKILHVTGTSVLEVRVTMHEIVNID